MKKKTTSLKINPIVWKRVKLYCIEKEIEISDWLEKLIEKELKKRRR